MDFQGEINALMQRLNLSDEELVTHQKASNLLSRTGSSKALDTIPEEKLDRIGVFYRRLRELGCYDYRADGRKFRRICTYYERWVQILRNDPRRPEMISVNESEVATMIENGIDELLHKMGIEGKTKGNMRRAVGRAFMGIQRRDRSGAGIEEKPDIR